MDVNGLDRALFLRMLHCIDGNYILVRFLSIFFELSSIQQDVFVRWTHRRIEDDRWDGVANDRMQYKEFIKALVMHYSGIEVKGEPTLKDFKSLLGEYLRSDEYQQACIGASTMNGLTFMEQLRSL